MKYILGMIVLLIVVVYYTYNSSEKDTIIRGKDTVTKPLKHTIQNTKEIITEEQVSPQIKINESGNKNKLKTDPWPPKANDGLVYYPSEELSKDISDNDMEENEKLLLKSFRVNKHKHNYKVYEDEDSRE